MDKKKAFKGKPKLSSMQEVTYQHEFKMADKAASRQSAQGKQ